MVQLYAKRHSRRRSCKARRHFSAICRRAAFDPRRRPRARHPLLEFRTGTGCISRSWSIAPSTSRIANIAARRSAGIRRQGSAIPALHENNDEGGLGWLRSFSGLMVTVRARPHPVHERRSGRPLSVYRTAKMVESSIHGRIGMIPGQALGYGERWDGESAPVVRRVGAAVRRCSAKICTSSGASRPRWAKAPSR